MRHRAPCFRSIDKIQGMYYYISVKKLESMHKKVFLLFSIFIVLAGCSSTPGISGPPKPWEEGRWNIYGFLDPEQDGRISHFYDNYDPETMNYKAEDLFWYRTVDTGNVGTDEFLESEVVYLGNGQEGIEFCSPGDMIGLFDTDKPSKSVFMNFLDIQKFSRNLDKYTILRIKYRYFYRPVYAPKNQVPDSINNRRISMAEKYGLMGISEFFLDEYEIIGKIDLPSAGTSGLLGNIISAVKRGTSKAMDRFFGIKNIIPEGIITLENGLRYKKVGLGEIVKNSRAYTGPDLLFSSRVRLIGDRGNNIWAFREAEGYLVHPMTYAGHISPEMKDLRIYYRVRDGGILEIDDVKQADISNGQW